MEAPASKGGIRTMPFIIANESIEKVASYGLSTNMILYLIGSYHLGAATATSILFIWNAVSNFLPIFGAFLSDSYLGRYRVIVWGSFASLLGMILLWLTALIPAARPEPSKAPSSSHYALLFSSFVLMSVGTGGIRPCSMAFGADQLNSGAAESSDSNDKTLQTFFNWYYVSVTISIMLAMTVVVYIQDHKGWKVGFGIPVALMAISALAFLLGSPLYKKDTADKGLAGGLARVLVASIKNRGIASPPKDQDEYKCYHQSKGSKLLAPTEKLRFFNKACIIRDREKDINADGSASNPWNLCTVGEVEDFKSLVKVLSLWSSGIMVAIAVGQVSFPVLQAKTMDRHLGSHFSIPPGSFGVFTILSLTIWVAIYDRILVPWISKYTGRPRGLSFKQRLGLGQLLSCIAVAVSAVVEAKRRSKAARNSAVVDWSAMWLVPQHCITGVAEAFNAIGQVEFYYSELPGRMSSIGVGLFSLSIAVGNLLGSLLVEVVDRMSRKGGWVSWVATDINKGHLDYYYWTLTALSAINFFYFLLCAWTYGACKEDAERKDEKKFGVEGIEAGDSDGHPSQFPMTNT